VALEDRIYPYLVPDGYPDTLTTPAGAQRRTGHGLSVALVSPTASADGQLLGAVSAFELDSAGMDLTTAYAHADRNLAKTLASGQISLEFLENGPAGVPTVVVSGHWLAATTLVATGLGDRMMRLLGDDIVAAVPHRDLLVVFSALSVDSMRGPIRELVDSAPKPLTTGLFALGTDGPLPIR
jgi:hypothetical protein